jgi:hypothetical protein
MRLEDYPRPVNDNRRGVHWSASVYHPTGAALDFWIAELQAMKIKWVKLLDDGGGSSVELCQRLLAAEIMPVVRLYRLEPNPGGIGPREEDTVRRLAAAGVRYFETNNEPDLPAEWKGGRQPADWLDLVIDSFIADADRVLGLGGLPALPALSAGSHANLVQRVVDRGRADLFEQGGWVAIHNYTHNHPLDYPYDAVNQEGQPLSQAEYDRMGQWGWEGRPRDLINQWRQSDQHAGKTLEDDASCFLAFLAVDEMARRALGYSVPIISTEGGPVIGWKADRRYPRIDPVAHAAWVVAITEFMQGTREIYGMRRLDSYFAMCHWLIANYRMGFLAPGWESQAWYTDWWNVEFNLAGELPVVARLKALPDVVAGSQPQCLIRGRASRADTGEPLPGQPVRLLLAGKEAARTETAADGGFAFERLASAIYDIAVEPWGVVRRGVAAAPVEAGLPPVILRLTGGKSSALAGVVQDGAGAPVPGVRVRLFRDGEEIGALTTEADGAFRFAMLPLGPYRLAIPGIDVAGIALDGWRSRSLRLTGGALAGYRYTVAACRLLPPEETAGRRLFYGRVFDAAGAPLNGVPVEMSWVGAPPDTEFPTTLTGRDQGKPAGYYEFVHTPGLFCLRVSQGDWPSESAENLDTATVAGREGQPVSYEVDFRLAAEAVPGQIDGAAPGGAAGIVLSLLAEDGTTRETALAADGTFAFADLPAGVYALSLAGVGVIEPHLVLEPGGLYKVLFPMRSKLAGRVLAPPDGLVAVLYAPPQWGWTAQAPLDASGAFAIASLPAGRYRLEIGGQVIPDIVLNGENTLQLAAIDLALGRRSVVRGRVADGAGHSQPDVLMTLRRADVIVVQARTAADGSYRFSNLPAGMYTLDAIGLGQVASLLLDGEREEVADVLWPDAGPRGAVQGRVLDATGAFLPNATVRLLAGDAEAARGQSDSAGGYRFSGLAEGVYALAYGDTGPSIAEVTLDEDATIVRDLILPPGPVKRLEHYVLFHPGLAAGEPGHAEARLAFWLALHHLARAGGAAGYSEADASQAERVTIIGDQLPPGAEQALAAAGCQVTRLVGDGYALAAGLAQLFAEG